MAVFMSLLVQAIAWMPIISLARQFAIINCEKLS
jgi:hypothetical protein